MCFYRASTKNLEALLLVQTNALRADLNGSIAGVKVSHRLNKACITRWGSTYDMLMRFFEPNVYAALCAVGASQQQENAAAVHNLPLAEDRQILLDILKVLTPLKVVTVLMQGDQYVTLSAVYPEL